MPIDRFIDSDWTVANARLCDFYGLPEPKTGDFQRVMMADRSHLAKELEAFAASRFEKMKQWEKILYSKFEARLEWKQKLKDSNPGIVSKFVNAIDPLLQDKNLVIQTKKKGQKKEILTPDNDLDVKTRKATKSSKFSRL